MYITNFATPRHKQMTFEDLLAGDFDVSNAILYNHTNTVTRFYEEIPESFYKYDKKPLVEKLRGIKATYADLSAELSRVDEVYQRVIELISERNQAKERKDWNTVQLSQRDLKRTFEWMEEDETFPYHSWEIPKKNGKLRRIDAPKSFMKKAQEAIRDILFEAMPATYHTNAYAYIHDRHVKACMQKHQNWESRWYCKFDFSDFFGSTTREFAARMLLRQFPFCMFDKEEKELLYDVLRLGFINNGLPQGTVLSPLLTNIMMIPFDHFVSKYLNQEIGARMAEGKQHDVEFIYTRYADDIIISCRYGFNAKEVESFLIQALDGLHAPFRLNTDKTRYGSRAGHNVNLGLLVNAQNRITLGAETSRVNKAILNNYACTKISGGTVSPAEAYEMLGKLSYWKFIEGAYPEYVFDKYSKKYGFNILAAMKKDANGVGCFS